MSGIEWPSMLEWIAELRSPDVGPQGRGALKDCDEARCCLGVLCDMAGVPHAPRHTAGGIRLSGRYDFGGASSGGSLPFASMPSWMGLALHDQCIDWNDNGETFADIADRLEAGA